MLGSALTKSIGTTTGTAITATATLTTANTFSINGTAVPLVAAAAGGTTVADSAVTEINKLTGTTGVTASVSSGALVLTSNNGPITLADGSGGGAGTLATLGLAAGTGTSVDTVKVGGDAIGGAGAGSVSVNGKDVAWGTTDTVTAVLAKLATAAGTGSTATIDDGRVKLTSANGADIKLANKGGGSLAQLGLSAGTSQAKLTRDTSIELNGVEVKFKKGDTSDTIVSSINSASTGVTASKNTDGTLKLFSDKDITVKNGAAGTG